MDLTITLLIVIHIFLFFLNHSRYFLNHNMTATSTWVTANTHYKHYYHFDLVNLYAAFKARVI